MPTSWLRRSLTALGGVALSLVGAVFCSTPSESKAPPESHTAAPHASPTPQPPPEPDSAQGFLLYQLPGAVTADAVRASSSHLQARRALLCSPSRLSRARDAWLDDDPALAAKLLDHIQSCDLPRALISRALFLRASALVATQHHQHALDTLDALGDDADVVSDHVGMLRAASLRGLLRPADAIPLYDRVIASTHTDRLHEARVERARAFHEAADFEAAASALADVISDYTEHPRLPRLVLLRATALLQLQRHREAAVDLERVIFDWPYKDAAREAQSLLNTLARDGITPPPRSTRQRLSRARWLRINKHWDIAQAALIQLLNEARTPDGHSSLENRIRYQIALNFYGPSNYPPAIALLRELTDLIDAGHGDGLNRSDVYDSLVDNLAYSGDHPGGLAVLQRATQNLSLPEQRAAIATYHEENGRFTEALDIQRALRSERQQQTWDHAFLLFKAQQFPEATRRLDALARSHKGRLGRQYRYWAARAFMKDGRLDDALTRFEALHKAAPLDYYGYQAHNRALEIQHALSSPPLTTPSTHNNSRTLPNGGGLLVARQNPTPSSPWRPSSPKLHHVDRNALTGAARLHWLRTPFPKNGLAAHLSSDTSIEGLSSFLLAYDSQEPLDGALSRARKQHGDLFPDLSRAAFLRDAGLETDARRAFRGVLLEYRALTQAARDGKRPSARQPVSLSLSRDRHYIDNRKPSQQRGYWGLSSSSPRFPIPSDPDARAALASRQRAILDRGSRLKRALRLAAKETGDYHLVRRWAHRAPFSKTRPESNRYREQWMEAHPRAFPRLVQRHAARNNLPPYLLWSIMLIESSYNPDTLSRADARGLLQVIPRTGIKVASSMGVDEYGPHDLLDERMSIRFGAWYLAQLTHKFRGQELLAAAGYNGGPHNVARWLTMRGHHLEHDAFIETIPFAQARLYAKKVTRFAGLYRRLYDREGTLYIGNHLDPDFRAFPNY